VEKFLTDLKQGFGKGDNKMVMVKIAKLKKVEQGEKTMEKFVQEFKRVVRRSGYEGRPLIEKFKRGINRVIRRKLIESECPLEVLSNSIRE